MIMMIDGVNAVVLAREFGLPTISSIASSGRLGTTSGSAKAIYYYLGTFIYLVSTLTSQKYQMNHSCDLVRYTTSSYMICTL